MVFFSSNFIQSGFSKTQVRNGKTENDIKGLFWADKVKITDESGFVQVIKQSGVLSVQLVGRRRDLNGVNIYEGLYNTQYNQC